MAPSLRMRHGFYCVLPLRTCAIILACINLLISTGGLLVSEMGIYGEMLHPSQTLHDDFDVDEEGSGEVAPTHGDPGVQGDVHVHEYMRYIIPVALVFNGINLIMSFVDIVLSCVLLYGAARRKSAFIRPWLYSGAAMMAYDVLYFLTFCALGIHFSLVLDALFHIPLVAYLWLVTRNLSEECQDAEQRAALAPLSMAALAADDDDEAEACSTPYRALAES